MISRANYAIVHDIRSIIYERMQETNDDIHPLQIDIVVLNTHNEHILDRLEVLTSNYNQLRNDMRVTSSSTSYLEVREPTAIFLGFVPNLNQASFTVTPLEEDVVVGFCIDDEYLYFRDLENNHFFMSFPIRDGYTWFFGGLNEQGQ